MNARALLRVYAGALAAGALLLVLQTATYQLITLGWPFRAAFALDDVAVFVTLRLLSKHAAPARAALGFATLFAVLTILADVPFPDLSRTLFVVGLPFALGLTLLSLSAIHTLSKSPRPRVLTVLVLVAVGVAVPFRVLKMVTSDSPPPIAFAWTSWAVEVLRPLLLAALAWSVSSHLAPSTPATPPASPYRDGVVPTGPEPLPDRTRPHADNADALLERYRVALVIRIAVLFVPVVLFVPWMAAGSSGRAAFAVFLLAIALASAASEAMLVARTSRLQRPLSEIAPKTSPLVTVARASLGLALAIDAFGVIGGAVGGESAAGLVFGAYLFGAGLSVLSFLAVARALAHIGERLGGERVVALARLLLAECIAAGALLLATMFVFVSGGREPSIIVVGPLLLGAGGITIAAFVCALSLLTQTRAALRSAPAH